MLLLENLTCKANAVSFQIRFPSESSYYAVEYDSMLNRHDDRPQKTASYHIPVSVIKGFNETIYYAMKADSVHSFFADAWKVKFQLGTQGDSQYGVFISADTSISKDCIKRLTSNVCLTTNFIP